MKKKPPSRETEALVRRLDKAVEKTDPQELCLGIKQALLDTVGPGAAFLPARFVRPAKDKYARRLLHKDPEGRYSVVVMVWGPKQGTGIHDHAGKWCVECVYKGRIRVDSYNLQNPDNSGGPFQLRKVGEVLAGESEAGALIPPFEYHSITNADATPSVTIHVYCEEMVSFNAFLPVDGGYNRVRRETYYTP